MSYYAADHNGYIGDVASLGGWHDFVMWAEGEDGDELDALVTHGVSHDPQQLADDLEATEPTGSVKTTVHGLIQYAKQAEGLLIISDGVGGNELRTAAQRETAVHAAADLHRSAIQTAVLRAFQLGRAAYKDGGATAAAKAVHDSLLEHLPDLLLRIVTDGGNAALDMLPKARAAESRELAGPKFTMSFDAGDPIAAKWAREHAAELAKGISETTREAIAEAIAEEQETGESAYDQILEAVGDESRAELIARTESMSAANEGQREAWDQAVEAGLLPDDARRVWIASADACPECDALDGEEVGLDEEYPNDGGDGPPLHPNCRCTEGIVGQGE